jgi:hypothetical protein
MYFINKIILIGKNVPLYALYAKLQKFHICGVQLTTLPVPEYVAPKVYVICGSCLYFLLHYFAINRTWSREYCKIIIPTSLQISIVVQKCCFSVKVVYKVTWQLSNFIQYVFDDFFIITRVITEIKLKT